MLVNSLAMAFQILIAQQSILESHFDCPPSLRLNIELLAYLLIFVLFQTFANWFLACLVADFQLDISTSIAQLIIQLS